MKVFLYLGKQEFLPVPREATSPHVRIEDRVFVGRRFLRAPSPHSSMMTNCYCWRASLSIREQYQKAIQKEDTKPRIRFKKLIPVQ
jgi:hypothetical protein